MRLDLAKELPGLRVINLSVHESYQRSGANNMEWTHWYAISGRAFYFPAGVKLFKFSGNQSVCKSHNGGNSNSEISTCRKEDKVKWRITQPRKK
jgi:Mor family transcriptional regulator